MFVDDKQRNLDVAGRLGYDTILADDGGRWHEQLDAWIGRASERIALG